MKKFISTIIISLALLVQSLSAQNLQTQWEAAANAYADKNYTLAAQTYDSILQYGHSADLLYNYANALYKSNNIGRAILNYERALLLDPSHADAAFNLEYLNSQITDKIDSTESFFVAQWLEALKNTLDSNSWAILSIIFFSIFLILTLLYLFANVRIIRKISFFSAITLLVLFIASFSYALSSKNELIKRPNAIVLAGSSSIKSTPDGSGTELFVLHEGTKITILSSLGQWIEIKIADGNRGWILATHIEQI